MKITAATRISSLIKANPAAVETIASINKHFEKLRNPILRRIMAPRVTIADAARIGNCSVDVFFEKLKLIGFEIEQSSEKEKTSDQPNSSPAFVQLSNASNTTQLDVRKPISLGQDPFQIIMDAIEKLPSGHTLLLINSFEPVPLIKILSKKGYSHFVENKSDGVVFTYLKNESGDQITIPEKENKEQPEDFTVILNRFAGKQKTIDVRQMEMPLPMVSILRELELLPSDQALYVHHKKVPQFLFPELQEKKFKWVIKEKGEGEVDLIIFR